MPLGTAAIIGLSLASAGASTASNVYNAKKASETNKRSIDAQSQESARAAELERQSRDADRVLAREQMAADQRRFDANLQANRDRWAAMQQMYTPLFSMMTGGGRGAGVPGIPEGGYSYTRPPEVATARPMVPMPTPQPVSPVPANLSSLMSMAGGR